MIIIRSSANVKRKTQIEISIELNLINKNQLDTIEDKINHLFAMMTNLIPKSH
jgi:hypothetical protein